MRIGVKWDNAASCSLVGHGVAALYIEVSYCGAV